MRSRSAFPLRLRGSAPAGGAILGLAAALALAGCFREVSSLSAVPSEATAAAVEGDVFLEGLMDAELSVGSSAPGETTSVEVFFFIPTGIDQPNEVVITVPAAFGFNGFDALGSFEKIGDWAFDFSNPGNATFDGADVTLEHFANGTADEAYSDSDFSATFNATDPSVTHTTGAGGEHVFTLDFPDGGDGDPNVHESTFDTDIRYRLFDGIAVNPSTPGDYTVTIEATAVDPDTGGDDDMAGTDPLTFMDQVVVTVPEPAAGASAAAALALLAGLRAARARRR